MIVPPEPEPVAPVDDDGEQPRAGQKFRELQRVDGEGPHVSIDGCCSAGIQRLDATRTDTARILTPP